MASGVTEKEAGGQIALHGKLKCKNSSLLSYISFLVFCCLSVGCFFAFFGVFPGDLGFQ